MLEFSTVDRCCVKLPTAALNHPARGQFCPEATLHARTGQRVSADLDSSAHFAPLCGSLGFFSHENARKAQESEWVGDCLR